MMRALSSGLAAVAASVLAQPAFAQQPEPFVLKSGLYFACTVAPVGAQAQPVPLDITYFVFGDRPRPDINFFDPSRLITQGTGVVSKKHFALSRLTSDGRLFVWLGRSEEGSAPDVDTALEVSPDPRSGDRTSVSVTHFDDQTGVVSAKSFAGNCEKLSGKPAWDRYQQPRRTK
jgi:hypothetical protein